MKYLIFILLPLMAACQERYRYPCQDPENWNDKMCQKPYCSANGTCPEDLRHYEKVEKNVPKQNTCPGSCK